MLPAQGREKRGLGQPCWDTGVPNVTPVPSLDTGCLLGLGLQLGWAVPSHCMGSEHHGPITHHGAMAQPSPRLYQGAACLPRGFRVGTGCWLLPPCPALLLAGQG